MARKDYTLMSKEQLLEVIDKLESNKKNMPKANLTR
jgi:hypothetical protein